MYNPIIHIGYPKTGTTWFNKSYYKKIKNVYFPSPESFLTQISDSTFIVPEIDDNKRLVIHDPELTGVKRFVWDKGLKRITIANNLKKYFPDATIVLFLRNQLDFLTSGYVYYVRKGGTFLPETMLDKIIKGEVNFTLDYLKYNETVDIYTSLFGKENVHVYLFEDFYNDHISFIEKYSKKYDFEININDINFSPVNNKMRNGLMVIMRGLNYFTKLDTPFKKNYGNVEFIYRNFNMKYHKFNSWKIFGNKAEINDLYRPEQIEFINKYFRESNKELVEKYKISDIVKYNYPL